MDENITWKSESALGKGLYTWWHDLHYDVFDEDGRLIKKADRASCAMLRRCASVDALVFCPAYQRFYRYMLVFGWPVDAAPWQNDKLAAIAGLLAHVKSDAVLDSDADKKHYRMPHDMSSLNKDRPRVSEMRFLDLLKADNTDELFVKLRRVLPLIDKHADIHQLARDVFYWNDATKKQWAYGYRWASKPSA